METFLRQTPTPPFNKVLDPPPQAVINCWLVQRPRRWTNIKPALGQHLVLGNNHFA